MTLTFPGFVDLQVNGFAGVDFNTPGLPPDRIKHALDAMRATGVTRSLPTLITSSFDDFAACARAILAVKDPAIAGIHMEGPYFSPLDGARGAHPREHVVPASIEDFKRRQDAAQGRIVLVTLAPEAPGATKLIEYLVGTNVCVAIGHTAGTREQIRDAIMAGATMSTHLGNGCTQTLHRHDNIIWEQLAADDLSASFIADGHHLPDAVLRSMVRAKGLKRSILVSDAISAAAAPIGGRYTIGQLEVELRADRRVGQPGAPNLAGSALTLDFAIGHLARVCGLAPLDVVPLATMHPAEYLGIELAGLVTAEWDAKNFKLTIKEVSG
jgi:N-acetylglucosamine-6-phosphate deacetylase